MTLHQLRALLERALHADGPTPPHIARLGSTVTVEDLARAYLPHTIRASHMYRMVEHAEPRRRWVDVVLNDAVRSTWHTGSASLDQIQAIGQQKLIAYDLITPETGASDPGTVNAVKVALALALGLDPGPMGCATSWRRRHGHTRWELMGDNNGLVIFTSDTATTEREYRRKAPIVAAEPDPVRALTLAAEHVLGAP